MNPGDTLPPEEPEMPVVIEKTRVNLFNLGGFVSVVFGIGVVWATTSGDVKTAQRDISDVQKAVQEIRDNQVLRAQIADRNNQKSEGTLNIVPQLQFNQENQQRQIEALQKSIEATNVKVDRFMELLNAKLDTIGENVNGLRVDVRVLSASGRKTELEEKRPPRQ